MQFSLARLMGAVTCCAIWLGAIRYADSTDDMPGGVNLFILVWAIFSMPALASWILTRNVLFAALVFVATFVILCAFPIVV